MKAEHKKDKSMTLWILTVIAGVKMGMFTLLYFTNTPLSVMNYSLFGSSSLPRIILGVI